jgi:hypothetical protein
MISLSYSVLAEQDFSQDLCNKHGIFKQTNKFRIPERQVLNLTIDIGDYMTVMNEFERLTPGYLDILKNFIALENMTRVNDLEFIDGMDHKVVTKITDYAHTAAIKCSDKGTSLIGLNTFYETSELKRILTKLDIEKVPVFLHRENRLTVVSNEGRAVSELASAWTEEDLGKKLYFDYSKAGKIGLGKTTDNGGEMNSDNVTILCVKTRTPFDIVNRMDEIRARIWTRKVRDYRTNLKLILDRHLKEKQALSTNKGISVVGKEARLSVPLKLIRVVEIMTRKVFDDPFWEMTKAEFDEMDELMKFVKDMIDMNKFITSGDLELEWLEFDESSVDQINLMEIGEMTILGKKVGFDNKIEVKIEMLYVRPEAEVKVFDFHPYINDRRVPEPGKMIITPLVEIFKKNFDVNSELCSEFNGEKYCKSFDLPQFDEKESNCAKFLLDKIGTNECELTEPEFPMAVKSDCHGEESLVSSFHSPYSLEFTCNDKPEKVTELSAGIHEIKTDCKVKSGATILVPQIKTVAEKNFVTRLIEIFKTNGDDNFKLILVCVIVVCVSILLLALNVVLIICLRCPDSIKNKGRCCCIIKISRRKTDQDLVIPRDLDINNEPHEGRRTRRHSFFGKTVGYDTDGDFKNIGLQDFSATLAYIPVVNRYNAKSEQDLVAMGRRKAAGFERSATPTYPDF